MAVITRPLNEEIFQQLKGVVDFYYWKSLLCARAYPKSIQQPGTPAQRTTWNAFNDARLFFKLLTQSDKKAYKYLAGGSHFTWRDLFMKVFLKGWWIEKRAPPMLYGLKVRNDKGKLKICATPTRTTSLRVCYQHGEPNAKGEPWRWVLSLPTPAPPNCSLRMNLLEHWEKQVETAVFPQFSESCEDVISDVPPGELYVTVKVIGGEHGSVLFRSGAWRLAF